MKFSARSGSKNEVGIQSYYSVDVKAMWQGLKSESPAFWWLCIYFFFEYVRPQSIYHEIDFLPWAQISLLLTCATVFMDKSITWVKSPVNTLFVIFYTLAFLSSIAAFNPSSSWDAVDILVGWILLYFLVTNILNTEKRFFIFLLLFLLANFKMSQNGAHTFALRGFSYAKWGVKGTPGWFSDSGDFGIAMVIFVPIAMAFVLALRQYWSRWKKFFFYLFPLTGVVTIMATSSRGAQLGMVAFGLWFLLKSRGGIKAILGIVIVGWALYSFLPDEMLVEYETAGDDGTSEDRLAHWAFGREVIKDYPVLGIGYNSWLDYCMYVNPEGLGNKYGCRIAHNTYIEAASEIGIPGFILYVAMILSIFIINAKTRKHAKLSNNKFYIYIAHGMDGGLVGYLVATIFFSVLFYPMFWVHLALSVALNQISRNVPLEENQQTPKKYKRLGQ
jgi:O-antigen ligase